MIDKYQQKGTDKSAVEGRLIGLNTFIESPFQPTTTIFLYPSATPRNNMVSGGPGEGLMISYCFLGYVDPKAYGLGKLSGKCGTRKNPVRGICRVAGFP